MQSRHTRTTGSGGRGLPECADGNRPVPVAEWQSVRSCVQDIARDETSSGAHGKRMASRPSFCRHVAGRFAATHLVVLPPNCWSFCRYPPARQEAVLSAPAEPYPTSPTTLSLPAARLLSPKRRQ